MIGSGFVIGYDPKPLSINARQQSKSKVAAI
jgi:hypothetical protein